MEGMGDMEGWDGWWVLEEIGCEAEVVGLV